MWTAYETGQTAEQLDGADSPKGTWTFGQLLRAAAAVARGDAEDCVQQKVCMSPAMQDD